MIEKSLITFLMILLLFSGYTQEVVFFSEGTNSDFYDQGIVNVNELGESTFEHTYPPGGPQWNDKVPCSTNAFKGSTSLKFNYKSSENGNWKVRIHRNDWSSVDISNLDSLSFFIFSETELPNSALPLIGVFSDGGTSDLDTLANYNGNIPATTWTQIKYPLDGLKGTFNLTQAKAVILSQSEKDNSSRLVLIDEVTAFKSIGEIPSVENVTAIGYDSHAHLLWEAPIDDLTYQIYASFDGGQSFSIRAETTENFYMDFVPEEGKNKTVTYRIIATAQGKESEPTERTTEIKDFTDNELLDMVQYYSFLYFWDGAHQATGMALERSNGNGRTAASGATGMGLMALIAAHEREYKPQEEIKDRILMILNFLETCDRHHGAWSHWYNADTKQTQPFSQKDDGGDIVETSFVAQGLVALKNYFSGSDTKSTQIREKANQLWREIDWDWYRQGGQNVLYWHWSPNYNFEKNMKVRGWNECLVTYIMAAASPTHSIPKEVYTNGWARNGDIANKREYFGFEISLARNWGGPLFWIHYTHHGVNPHGLKDEYADYWQEHVNTAKIHYEYAKANPKGFINYSENCWGLTASDDPDGYSAHKPMDNDNGTISPTAALASMPYTPEESMKALKYFYRERGSELFGKYGPYDAFNDSRDWIKESYIGIDQGPIVIMIENHRSGLLWNNVMKDSDVQEGLDKLGFEYTIVTGKQEKNELGSFKLYPNPANDRVTVWVPNSIQNETFEMKVFDMSGKLIQQEPIDCFAGSCVIDCSAFQDGLYLIQLINGKEYLQSKLLIQK